jgi:hypothetical protein
METQTITLRTKMPDGQPQPSIAVYDPAMCCSTGVCGPSVDPEVLRVVRDLQWIEGKGATVQRFNLSQEPGAFVENPRVAGLLQAFGDKALPVTLVNGDVLAHGHYPSRDELLSAVNEAPTTAAESEASTCEPESGCCS